MELVVFVIVEHLLVFQKPFHLKVEQVGELFPSHPVRQHNDQRHIANFHLICCLVEVPLHKS